MTDRRDFISNYIHEKGTASIQELTNVISDVSEMTIRRDLEFLEKKGEVIRVHGGAKSLKSLTLMTESNYANRMHRNTEKKHAVAAKALSLIETGGSYFLDCGTTTLILASKLADVDMLITTSAPNIALELMRLQNCGITLLGGELNRSSISLTGPVSSQALKNININVAFLCASGYTEGVGFTSSNIYESELKKAVIEKASKTIMLMDSSKFGVTMPYTFASEKDVNTIVSDDDIDLQVKKHFTSKGIEVI